MQVYHKLYSTLLGLSCFYWAQGQQTDTLELAPATVQASVIQDNSRQLQLLPSQSVSLSTITEANFGGETFIPAINHTPGIRFEQRAPGSYRIVMRGTSRRSPFGVRGTRVYWNGIALTEPGGDTPLNFLDLTNVDRITAVKGPNATLYSADLGGLLLLETQVEEVEPFEKRSGPSTLSLGLSAGNFNTFAGNVKYTQKRVRKSDAHVEVRLAHRQTDGYRDHSAFERTTAQLSLLDSNWLGDVGIHVLGTQLAYQLPGALTPIQYAENPKLARPGSALSQAGIDYRSLLVGSRFERRIKGGIRLNGSGYVSGFSFDNPFNVNHKRENNLATGARFSGNTYLPLAELTNLSVGAEVQVQQRAARQYDPANGTPGDLQFIDDIYTEYYAAFAELVSHLKAFSFTLGIRAEQTSYEVERTFSQAGITGLTTSSYRPQFSPRASVKFKPTQIESLQLSASIASGISAPTLREFRTNEGSLNRLLLPERGLTYELNAQWQSNRFLFSATGYLSSLSQTITTFQDSSGIQLFRNAGKTIQPGIELLAEYQPSREKGPSFSAAYTYAPYRYSEYEVNGTSFAERPMPGIPPHILDVQIGYLIKISQPLAARRSIKLSTNVRYEAENPLDDSGAVSAEAFWLLRAEAAYRFRTISVSLSADNLLDIDYSLGNDLNPRFGNRYFQPAPGRNFTIGIKISNISFDKNKLIKISQ